MTTLLNGPTTQNRSLSPVASPRRECWFWAGWEPDRYYRRIGARSTLYFGNGDWIADWRAKLEGRACLKALQEAGGSLLITRFYKGFGLAVERKEWDSLKRFVELAHAHGIKVWGYLQGQSLFGEFLFNEQPEARDWVARSHDGTQKHWAGAYNRFAICLTSPEYLKMLESVVREGLKHVNLDGFHMDNNYYSHCYCSRCKRLFREWLSARGDLETLTGIEKADCVEPPPLSQEAEMLPDPLAILWIEFGVQQRLKFMKAIRRHIKQIKQEAGFTGNPAFMRSFASRLTYGFDPALEREAFDSVCIENGNRPRFSEGVLFTQADKHLIAEAGSLRTWVTSWSPAKSGYEMPLDAQGIWAGLAEEFSFSNALLGNNWALRPVGDGGAFLKEKHATQWAEFEIAAQYFKDLEIELGAEPRCQWGEIVLYVDTRSLSLCPASDAHVLQALMARLFLKQTPFKVIFQGQPIPKEAHTVLICGQRSLKASEFECLAAFVARSNRQLWLLGECGVVDEWFVPRGVENHKKLVNRANVRSIPLPLHQWTEGGPSGGRHFQGTTPSFSEEGVVKLDRVLKELARRQSIQITAPYGILVNVESMGDSVHLLHLRDLREGKTQVNEREVRVTLKRKIREVKGFSRGWDSALNLLPEESHGVAEICVPEFHHYACLSIE